MMHITELLRDVVIGVTAAMAMMAAAATPAAAALPEDTVRAGHCSLRQIAEPDTSAAWWKVVLAWNRESPGSWPNDSLRTELLALAKADQAVRDGVGPESAKDPAFLRRMRLTDSSIAVRMRAILVRYGWPGKHLVGVKGAEAAFLLVQHSPELIPLGSTLVRRAAPGDVSPGDVALLTDRERIIGGHSQLFGSQLRPFADGVWTFYPIDDPEHLEARRARAGLPPMRAYACQLATMYRAPVVVPDGVE
jgi:hypothetical protein